MCKFSGGIAPQTVCQPISIRAPVCLICALPHKRLAALHFQRFERFKTSPAPSRSGSWPVHFRPTQLSLSDQAQMVCAITQPRWMGFSR